MAQPVMSPRRHKTRWEKKSNTEDLKENPLLCIIWTRRKSDVQRAAWKSLLSAGVLQAAGALMGLLRFVPPAIQQATAVGTGTDSSS